MMGQPDEGPDEEIEQAVATSRRAIYFMKSFMHAEKREVAIKSSVLLGNISMSATRMIWGTLVVLPMNNIKGVFCSGPPGSGSPGSPFQMPEDCKEKRLYKWIS